MNSAEHFCAVGEDFVLEHFGIKGMRWGVRKDPALSPSDGGRSFTKAEADAISGGYRMFGIIKPKQLSIREVDGVTVLRPKNGFKNERAKQLHDDLLNNVLQMRKEYPAVAQLKIVVAPTSHMALNPGKSTEAGVLHTRDGHLVVAYNDSGKSRNARQQARFEKLVPGMKHPGYASRHEMGHVIAAAGRLTPNATGVARARNLTDAINSAHAHHTATENNHTAAMQRHGLDFKELAKLSPYAASAPSEAYAELAGHYYTPALNAKMSPELRTKAKSMFNEAGGVK